MYKKRQTTNIPIKKQTKKFIIVTRSVFCVPLLAKSLTATCARTVDSSYDDDNIEKEKKHFIRKSYFLIYLFNFAVLGGLLRSDWERKGNFRTENEFSHCHNNMAAQRKHCVNERCKIYKTTGDRAVTLQPELPHYDSMDSNRHYGYSKKRSIAWIPTFGWVYSICKTM